jgi:hypothetical protein
MKLQKVLVNVNKLPKQREEVIKDGNEANDCDEYDNIEQIKAKARNEQQNILSDLLEIKKLISVNEPVDKFIQSEFNIQPKSSEDNIYNDDNFYRHLLRKVIESKSCALDNKKWLQVQKLRSKMKRKIDTKCSKGRKIRYQVYKELVGFMAPVDCNDYENNAKDALFLSLFGKKVFK